MQQVFIELFNFRPAWRALPAATREEYVQAVLQAVKGQASQGVEVIGWGFNDPATDRRAPFDFYCVYRTPSVEYQRGFEAQVTAAGWHEYFDQVHVSGAASTPDELLPALAALRLPSAQQS